MAITLKGIVLPDGKIEVQGESPLRPGEQVEITVFPPLPKMGSISLEEAKRRFAEPEREMTPEEEALYHEAYRLLDKAVTDDAGWPEDYVDELDHYLYGTPKRSESEESENK